MVFIDQAGKLLRAREEQLSLTLTSYLVWQGHISNNEMIKYIVIVCLLFVPLAAIQISPFSTTLLAPQHIFRIAHTAASLNGTQNSFTISYPYSSWNSTPIILQSVTGLTFANGLKYEIQIASKSTTSLQTLLTFNQTLTSISFLILLLDSSLYSATLTQFTYSLPQSYAQQQSFTVPLLENSNISFTVALDIEIGNSPGGLAPLVQSFIVSTGNLVTTNLSISFNTSQLLFKYFKIIMVDFHISNFKALPHYNSGQKWVIYGTSGISTDPLSTPTSLSLYKTNYFTGLTTIYDCKFSQPNLSLNISTATTSNTFYFTSQIIIASYFCPTRFPITDHNRQFCYSGCAVDEYFNDQFMCLKCDVNCKTCYLSGSNCTSCAEPYVLLYGFVCGCPEDQYAVTLKNGTIMCTYCFLAIQGCYSCNSQINCTRCMNNLVLNTTTICQCPLNTTLLNINNASYCINDQPNGTSYIVQNCPSLFYQEELTCQCNSNFNLTFDNATCIPNKSNAQNS